MAEVTDSDKLAIALACAAGVMAIILFLIEKTPLIVGLSLASMVGLAVYPIFHFFREAAFRIVAVAVMLGLAVLIGWQAWPIKKPSFVEVSGGLSQGPVPNSNQGPAPVPAQSSAPTAKTKAKTPRPQAATPQPPMSQECAPGASCAQSSGQQGGITAGVYNATTPLELKTSLQVIPSNTGKFGFQVNECPVKTQITITPNEAVPPPISVALEFDNPISKIASIVLGVNGWTGGGAYRLGTHALTPPITSPGINATHPLLVEVCSAEIVKLVGEPHLE